MSRGSARRSPRTAGGRRDGRLSSSARGFGPSIELAVNVDSVATWLLLALATEVILALHRKDESRTATLLDGSVMAAVTPSRDPVPGCATRRHRLDPPRHLVPGSEAFVQVIALCLGWGVVPDLQSGRLRDSGVLALIGVGRPGCPAASRPGVSL